MGISLSFPFLSFFLYYSREHRSRRRVQIKYIRIQEKN